jgi:hypothetical protein
MTGHDILAKMHAAAALVKGPEQRELSVGEFVDCFSMNLAKALEEAEPHRTALFDDLGVTLALAQQRFCVEGAERALLPMRAGPVPPRPAKATAPSTVEEAVVKSQQEDEPGIEIEPTRTWCGDLAARVAQRAPVLSPEA